MRPSLPQGTRDFSSEVVRKRDFIFNAIRSVFELYGFQPLETPAMENMETLMGKYGDEGDKLIFKILNNGLENPSKQELTKAGFEKILEGKNTKDITERALRYDLTIPFARYVAMNHCQLIMPFKRYQIQPVWRADRPQRGRYREFYQCDADVVGSHSLLNEVELANIYTDVFKKLRVDIEIRINSRKILAALAELCGGAERMMDITIAIDKLDKIGLNKVKEELEERGLEVEQISIVDAYLAIEGDAQQKITALKRLLGHLDNGKKGIEEIEFLLNYSSLTTPHSLLTPDFTLARGLNYYTGIIFEVKALNVQMGSIGGGGRYDDLTGLFGVPNVPGVGISFGVDRIYDVMEELQIFPHGLHGSTKVLFFNLGQNESRRGYALMQQLRQQGVSAELYHENAKFDKQFKYAERKGIGHIIILGSKELEQESLIIKNLATGQQQIILWKELNNVVNLINEA